MDAVRHITEGVSWHISARNFKEKQEEEALDIELCGISEGDFEEAQSFQENAYCADRTALQETW